MGQSPSRISLETLGLGMDQLGSHLARISRSARASCPCPTIAWDVLSWDILSSEVLSWEVLSWDVLNWSHSVSGGVQLAPARFGPDQPPTLSQSWDAFRVGGSQFGTRSHFGPIQLWR
jgi:hypothetical protein